MQLSSTKYSRDLYEKDVNRVAIRSLPSTLFFVGIFLFVVTERGFQNHAVRMPILMFSILILLMSLGIRLRHSLSDNVEARGVHRTFLALYVPIFLSALAYVASYFMEENGSLLLGSAVLLLFSTTFLHSILSWTLWPMQQSGWIEPRQIRVSLQAGVSFLLALLAFGLMNYSVKKNDWRYESGSIGSARPSLTTRSLWKGNERKIEVFLFFAKNNPLLKDVEDYFLSLQPDLKLNILDPAMSPSLAKEMKVSRQGTVALRLNARSEKTYIGKTLKEQNRGLKKLDKEVRTGLARLTREEIAVHFTVGHGERRSALAGKKERPGMSNFRKRIKEYNATPKTLGLQEGLGTDIADDTQVVMVLGPRTPFLKEEVDALMRYVDNGGALLLAIDPTAEHGLDDLLHHVGIELSQAELASDKVFLRQTHTRADHVLLPSNRFSSHAVTRPLKKREEGMVIFAGAGGISKYREGELSKKSRISFVARSHESTFVDVKRNFLFDKEQEKRGVQNFIAAISFHNEKQNSVARIVVIGDSEVFSDGLWPVAGNQILATQTLLWLLGDDRTEGEAVVNSDVEIKHTRDEDVIWFYSSVFGMPLLVLMLGMMLVRRRKKMRGAA